MAILFATGFEAGHANLVGTIYSVGGISGFSTTNVRSGNRSLYAGGESGIGGSAQTVTIAGVGDVSELYLTIGVRFGGDGRLEIALQNGNTLTLGTTTVGGVRYLRLTMTTIGTIGTSSFLYTLGTWRHIQLRWKATTVGGIVQLYEDGELTIDYSGDAQPADDSNLITLLRLHSGIAGTSNYAYIDDVIWDDAQFHGDARFELLVPDGDAAAAWTPSTGLDNYALVDEAPAIDDNDYVETATDALDDLYTLSAWDGTDKTPIGLAVWRRAWKTTADDQRISFLVNSGATLDVEAPMALTTSAMTYYRVVENNPDGDVAWDETAINALEVGQRSVVP